MKLDSKYFDSIRSRPDVARLADQNAPACQWKGCQSTGLYRAPQGRGREGQYYLLCLDHVRQFNASYNYFQGMSNAEVEAYQKDSVVGHRPTWKAGANAWAHGTQHGGSGSNASDPHRFFNWRAGRGADPAAEPRRPLRPLETKALDLLDLGGTATKVEIKARFKELVKRHHPDANGGDTRSEDKLREIIQAYNYLKQAGLV